MEGLKHYYVLPFVFIAWACTIFSGYQFVMQDYSIAWLGAAIAVIPIACFFAYLVLGNVARTERNLSLQLISGISGTAISAWDFQWLPFGIAAIVGLLGTAIYIFWYTPLNRSQSQIKIGEKLPKINFNDIDGQSISTQANDGKNKVWMFIRANWCPLCVAQVRELAEAYKELEAMNADVFLISSQPEDNSRKLAAKFDVPIRFLVDNDNQAAKTLGIEHIGGTPFGMLGYEANTAMPTVIITDANDIVIFADQTDDYRIRPEPGLFIQALKNA